MEQIINISMETQKEIIRYGTVEYSITVNMKSKDSYCQTWDSGYNNTMLMDIDLMELRPCCTRITVRVMDLLETTINTLISF